MQSNPTTGKKVADTWMNNAVFARISASDASTNSRAIYSLPSISTVNANTQ